MLTPSNCKSIPPGVLQAEALYQQFKAKKDKLAIKSKASVMETYGNAAEAAPDEALLLGQTERYVEYDASGRLIKYGCSPAPAWCSFQEKKGSCFWWPT